MMQPRDLLDFRPTTARERRVVYATLAGAVIATAAYVLVWPITYPLDDAYITLHNAHVLLAGHDVNYPGVSPLAGATSPVHLLVITISMLLISPEQAALLVATLMALCYVTGVARLAFALGAGPGPAALFGMLSLLAGNGTYQLFNGLETGMAMAAITWALILAIGMQPDRRLAALCGIMPFIRPELGVLAGLLMVRQTFLRGRSRQELGAITADFALAATTALPWFLWLWIDTGSPIPTTASAKVAYFASGGSPSLAKLDVMVRALNPTTLVPALLGFFVLPPRRSISYVAWGFLAIFLAAYFLRFPNGLHHNEYRYLQVLAPLSIMGLMFAARDLRGGRVLLLSACLMVAFVLPGNWLQYRNSVDFTRRELADVAEWSTRHLPANARILIHDAGYVAYATDFRLVDVVGLKTPSSIPYHRELTAPSSGAKRGLAIHRIALAQRPTHAIVLADRFRFWAGIVDDLRRYGWQLEILRPVPPTGGYAIYALTPPDRPSHVSDTTDDRETK